MTQARRDRWISRIEWVIIFAVALADMMLAKATGIPMDFPVHNAEAVGIIVALWPLTAFLTRRFGFAVGSEVVAENASKFFIFILVISAFEYYLATNPAPLQDETMVRIDRAMGFDWPSFFGWVRAHPLIAHIMGYIYASMHVQAALILFVVAIFYPRRGRFFVTAFLLSALLTMIVYGSVPVAGPFVYFGHTDLPQAYYTKHYLNMRNHVLASVPLDDIRGIVSFPSFHVSSAVVLTYFFRRIRVLWLVALLVNIAMAVAALVIGGHYLIDVIAGLGVGLVTIGLVRLLEGGGAEPRLL